MTVKELIAKLKLMPQDSDVCMMFFDPDDVGVRFQVGMAFEEEFNDSSGLPKKRVLIS